MSRVIRKECKLCGESYGYMASGYGVSPREWNASRGVTRHCCAGCAPKATSLQIRLWDLREKAERVIENLEWMMESPDKWLGVQRFGEALRKMAHRVEPMLFKCGPVSVQPMRQPTGGILFWEYKYREKADG